MVIFERSLETRINSDDGTKLLEKSQAWLLCQTSLKSEVRKWCTTSTEGNSSWPSSWSSILCWGATSFPAKL